MILGIIEATLALIHEGVGHLIHDLNLLCLLGSLMLIAILLLVLRKYNLGLLIRGISRIEIDCHGVSMGTPAQLLL